MSVYDHAYGRLFNHVKSIRSLDDYATDQLINRYFESVYDFPIGTDLCAVFDRRVAMGLTVAVQRVGAAARALRAALGDVVNTERTKLELVVNKSWNGLGYEPEPNDALQASLDALAALA